MTKLITKLQILLYFFVITNISAQVPVLTNPQNQTVMEGQTATFSVARVSGTLPFTYQWQATLNQNPANFQNIPGATNSSYTTPPTTLSMNNSWYRCVVTNDSGTTNSNYAILTVNPIISPSITLHPTDKNIYFGQTATFNVAATGTAPLSYQWYVNSVPISGANSTSYTTEVINDISADGRIYYCVVSNTGGSVESNSATLNVSFENSRVTNGLQVLYDFKEGSGNTVNDKSGVGSALNLSINNSNSVVWTPKGLNVNADVRIKSSNIASKIYTACTQANEMTFEAWLLPTDMTQRNLYTRIMTLSNNNNHERNFGLIHYGSEYHAQLRTSTTTLNGTPATVSTNNVRKLTHYVYTRSADGTVAIYIDGAKVVNDVVNGNLSNWNNDYYLYLGSEVDGGYWEGTYYLTAIYSKALSAVEVGQNYNFGVNSDILPLFIKNPVSQTLVAGATATFSAKAIGGAPTNYQWRKNGTNIAGATSTSYTTPALSFGDNGAIFDCVATTPEGSATSAPALVNVTIPNERITSNVIAMYTFDEGSGNIVHDVSGVGTPVDLVISDPNAVTWTTNGLQINSETDIFSSGAATKIQSMCASTNRLTVETWIKSADTAQSGPARIVTFSIDGSNRNFMIAQEGSTYEGRVRTNTTSSNALPSVTSATGSATTDLQHVVIEFRTDQVLILFINGEEVMRRTLGGDFSTWNTSYRLSIANELLDSFPWLGTINYLAIFNTSLNSTEILHNYEIGPYGLESINSPSDLTTSVSEVGKVNLIWSDNSNNEDGFLIERGTGDPVVWESITTTLPNVVTYTDESVNEGIHYSYRVKAINNFANLNSNYSNISTATTLMNKPSGLVGKVDVIGKISLVWNDNSNNEAGYIIERGVGTPVVYSPIDTTSANITSYDDTSVGEGIQYSYRIKAYNQLIQSDYSNSILLRSKASFVLAPSDLNIQLESVRKIPVLNWVDNAFNEFGFVVERRRSQVGSDFVTIDSVGQDVVTFTDSTVHDSATFIYRVYAYNEDYVSEFSNTAFIDVLTGISQESKMPEKFSLLQNYPNPFNPTTTITFNLPEVSEVIIKLYNLLGQEISTLVENRYDSGVHTFNLDASGLTSGIYIYTLTAKNGSGKIFVQSKKLTLLK